MTFTRWQRHSGSDFYLSPQKTGDFPGFLFVKLLGKIENNQAQPCKIGRSAYCAAIDSMGRMPPDCKIMLMM